eukprot:9207937-Alexandrium_andersonii.AAC.1
MKLRSSVSGSIGEIWHVLVLRSVGRRTRDGVAELCVGKLGEICHMLVFDAQAIVREMELRSSASEA